MSKSFFRKKYSGFNILIFMLVFIPFISTNLSAESVKPNPPRNLKSFLNYFRDIEEAHRENEISEALESLNEFEEKLYKIEMKIKDAGGDNQLSVFKSNFKEYKSAVENKKDAEEVEDEFVDLQMSFLNITNIFNYKTPLIFTFFKDQIDEFKEEVLEGGEWDEGETEIEEIESLWDNLKDNQLSGKEQSNKKIIDEHLELLEKYVGKRDTRKSIETVSKINSKINEIIKNI